MKCEKCGSNIPEGAKFCHVCGAGIVPVDRRPNQDESVSGPSADTAGPDRIPHKRNDTVCPFCGETTCQPMQKSTTEIKNRGYQWGSGCCGMFLLGPFGLLCGLCGTGSRTKVENELWWTCTACGKQHIALEDALKKWELTVTGLIPRSVGIGIGILIEKIIFQWILDALIGIGFITSAAVFLLPFVMTYFYIHSGWEEVEKEISSELGESIDPYLTAEQKDTRKTNLLISAGIMLVIGLFGPQLLNLILGE